MSTDKTNSFGHYWLDACYQRKWWLKLLLPISWCFNALAAWRRRLQQSQSKVRFPVPIVVIGNITLGGSGKTPLLIGLAKRLQQEGLKPGIVSRGYGGRATSYPLKVTSETNPGLAGDEPVLIARETGCPVVVSPSRPEAVKALLSDELCDLVLSDDGLQHYRLPRDMEIIVIDGERGLGNTYCLPAGPLREPVARLREADWVVVNGKEMAPSLKALLPKDKVYTMGLEPEYFQSLQQSQQRIDLPNIPAALLGNRIGNGGAKVEDKKGAGRNRVVKAVAAIGNPQRFFNTLSELGLKFESQAFPDHHAFALSDFREDDEVVVMTAKDAVKCENLVRDLAEGIDSGTNLDRWWYLSVVTQLPEAFYQDFLQRFKALKSRREFQ